MRYRTRKIIGAVAFVDEEGKEVGHVRGPAQVDSRKMAAGPAMYEALRDCLDYLTGGGLDLDMLIDDTKTVLAQAEGKDQ